jgi:hypothetical protein
MVVMERSLTFSMKTSKYISLFGGAFILVHNSKNSQMEEVQDACFTHWEVAELSQELILEILQLEI